MYIKGNFIHNKYNYEYTNEYGSTYLYMNIYNSNGEIKFRKECKKIRTFENLMYNKGVQIINNMIHGHLLSI